MEVNLVWGHLGSINRFINTRFRRKEDRGIAIEREWKLRVGGRGDLQGNIRGWEV